MPPRAMEEIGVTPYLESLREAHWIQRESTGAELFVGGISLWYLGRYRWWGAALGGLASAFVVLFVFVDLLGLSFLE